jgi:predicted RNA-binding Zn-ribbon protein involved in translation (DUF1610 family)
MTNNIKRPPIRISHTKLKRWNEESPYKSLCPTCETGPLLIVRDHTSGRLTNVDRCLGCGQMVIYLDATINDEALLDVAGIRNEN